MDGNQEMETSLVGASDGARLSVYSWGDRDRPIVLIVNAVGMPMEFVRPLAERISNTHRVITWESRCLPSPSSPETESNSTNLERQARDGVEILVDQKTTSAVLIGWCAGARLALRLMQSWNGTVDRLVLLNGGFGRGMHEYTQFERNFAKLLPRLSKDSRYTEKFHRIMFPADSKEISFREISTGTSADLLGDSPEMNTAIEELVSLPFRTAENLYQYSRLLMPYVQEPLDRNSLPDVATLVMTCERDLTTSPENSRQIAMTLSNATLITRAGGDHFSLYWDLEYIEHVVDFVSVV